MALADPGDDAAVGLLQRYYGQEFGGQDAFAGAAFDWWDSAGTRDTDSNRFTADDLVAVTFLSVDIPAPVARALLAHRRGEFSELLEQIGPDRDLVDEPQPLGDDWPGWRLMAALRAFDDVGPTTASKLVARKRPRLRPIWDSVVSAVTDTVDAQWEPMREALRADGKALHHRLLRLRDIAGLPAEISALRVFDVIAWCEGKDRGLPRSRRSARPVPRLGRDALPRLRW